MTRLCLIGIALALAHAQGTRVTSGVNVATMEFLATDSSGIPVADLRKDELVLMIDGARREITYFEFFPDGQSAARSTNIDRPVNSPIISRRRIVFAVDHESIHMGDERQVITSATTFLSRLPAGEDITVLTLPHGRIISGPGASPAERTRALQFVVGHADKGFGDGPCAKDPQARNRLRAIVDFLGGLPRDGRPTEFIYVSGGLPSSSQEGCAIEFDEIRRVAEAARARFFVFQPNSNPAATSTRSVIDTTVPPHFGLEDLAGVTGGELFRISGRADEAFAKVAREISGRFLLGFESTAADNDGKTHRVRLTATRSGVEVRAPKEMRR